MAKLTKAQTKAHNAACELLEKDELTDDERIFVLENWHEGAERNDGEIGAFFTPLSLAWDFEIDVPGVRIVDLCAGIGSLAFTIDYRQRHSWDGRDKIASITCIEQNPAFVEVGKKILPNATWICGDATDPALLAELGQFDCAIGNPPFGKRIKTQHAAPRYTGSEFEFKIIDIARDLADYGTFIVPQMSAPFRFSGRMGHSDHVSATYKRFHAETGIRLDAGCGIDTAVFADDWKSKVPVCEIVTADYSECEENEAEIAEILATPVSPLPSHAQQMSLF